MTEARREGEKINLTGVPTFIINEKYKNVGAQPVDVFKDAFNKDRVMMETIPINKYLQGEI